MKLPAFAVAAAMLLPQVAIAQERDGEAPEARAPLPPVDPEPDEEDTMRYPPSSVRYGLVTGGIGVFGIAYGFSAMSASLWPEVPGSDFLYVPVVGPFLSLTQSGCSPDSPDCDVILYVRGALYILDVLAQMGGLGLIGEGLFMTTEADAPGPDTATMTIVPQITPDATGAALVGQF